MKYIEFENYKKNSVVLLITLFFAGCILPLVHFIVSDQIKYDIKFLVLGFISLFFGIFLFRFLVIILKNYNKIYYFKISEKKFEYLAIPSQVNPSRAGIIDIIKAIYFDPTYNQKLFQNIIKFERKNYTQIKMITNDGSEITIRLNLSEEKLIESISELNACLLEYKKNYGER